MRGNGAPMGGKGGMGRQHAHKLVGGFQVNMILKDKVMLAHHDDDGRK